MYSLHNYTSSHFWVLLHLAILWCPSTGLIFSPRKSIAICLLAINYIRKILQTVLKMLSFENCHFPVSFAKCWIPINTPKIITLPIVLYEYKTWSLTFQLKIYITHVQGKVTRKNNLDRQWQIQICTQGGTWWVTQVTAFLDQRQLGSCSGIGMWPGEGKLDCTENFGVACQTSTAKIEKETKG